MKRKPKQPHKGWKAAARATKERRVSDDLKEMVYNALSSTVGLTAVQVARLMPASEYNLVDVRTALKQMAADDGTACWNDEDFFRMYRKLDKKPAKGKANGTA